MIEEISGGSFMSALIGIENENMLVRFRGEPVRLEYYAKEGCAYM